MIHSEEVIDMNWCKLHFRVTDMISDEVFVWVTDVRMPTRAELSEALARARSLTTEYLIYANVIASDAIAMRFARHFGFREVRRNDNISIQVWEKDKWARLHSSH